MLICPRGLAALVLIAGLVGCGDTNPPDDGSHTQTNPGDTNVPTGGDPNPTGGDPGDDGDHDTSGGDDDGSSDTPAHICKDVYNKIISCCSVMAFKTQQRFMLECELDPFSAHQRDQFVATSCDSLASLCSVGNACPVNTSCFQVGVGVGVCADHGNYPDDATACDVSTDCSAGLACYGDGTTNFCVQTCIPPGDGYTVGQCPPDRTCVRLADGTHVCGDGDSVPADAPSCHVIQDCDSGWSCVFAPNADTGNCLQQCIGN
jgi:hypothetical protein